MLFTRRLHYNPLLGSWTQNAAGRLAMVEWGHETACPGSQVGRWYEFYSYTAAGLVTKKRMRLQRQNYLSQMTTADLDGAYGWNNEGQMTTMTQPGYYTGTPPAGTWNNGASYTLGYDTMARLTSIQQTAPSVSWVISSMGYGAANQVTSIAYGTGQVQTRQYNERLQMTRMTVSGLMDLEYKFSTSANNGQATAMKNWISGEEVQYTYDSLKRLTAAATVGPEWGQSYTYDGFGNLLSKTVTKGSAPAMSVSINP